MNWRTPLQPPGLDGPEPPCALTPSLSGLSGGQNQGCSIQTGLSWDGPTWKILLDTDGLSATASVRTSLASHPPEAPVPQHPHDDGKDKRQHPLTLPHHCCMERGHNQRVHPLPLQDDVHTIAEWQLPLPSVEGLLLRQGLSGMRQVGTAPGRPCPPSSFYSPTARLALSPASHPSTTLLGPPNHGLGARPPFSSATFPFCL